MTIRRFMDLSTAHITLEDHDLLAGEHPHPIRYPYNYGWFVHVPEDATLRPEFIRDLEIIGFSAEFVALVRKAMDEGCCYICLDQDGDVEDGLPTFDW